METRDAPPGSVFTAIDAIPPTEKIARLNQSTVKCRVVGQLADF
jgi:hypothetical protein